MNIASRPAPGPSDPQAAAPTGAAPRLWPGLAIWLAFTVVAVAVRGVRWDDNYQYAQVILGEVVYPTGHPMAQWARGMFSLQTWITAGLMRLGGGALVANGSRNVLFLLATVWPVFSLATILTRRAVWGHLASVLVLLGVHARLFSTYPIQTWPEIFGTGHIGTGWVLMTVAMLVGGRLRTAYFMAGLTVAVHLGQLPPVLVLCAIHLALTWRAGESAKARSCAAYALLGAVPAVVLWLLTRSLAEGPPASGPYVSQWDPWRVWRGFMAHRDSHRLLPVTIGQYALIGTLLLATARAREAWVRRARPGPWLWLAVYLGACAAIVWTVMLVHVATAGQVPYLMIGWLPYRLMNHAAILAVPVTLACLGAPEERSGSAWLGAAAGAVAAVMLALGGPRRVEPLGPGPVTFLEGGDGILYGLFGAAVGVTAARTARDLRFCVPWVVVVLAGVLAMTVTYPSCLAESTGEAYVRFLAARYSAVFPAVCVAAGFVTGVALRGRRIGISPAPAMALACALIAAMLLVREGQDRRHLPVTGFERRVTAYLESTGESDALIVVPHQQESLQARLGHPVSTDLAAYNWIPYRPSLGPAQRKLYLDLYGIDLAPDPAASVDSAWETLPERKVWPRWSRAHWRRLAREYGFRYVYVPSVIRLDLPIALDGDDATLYVVPGTREALGASSRLTVL